MSESIREWQSCENCAHFQNDREADERNPCTKNHKMQFRRSSAPDETVWGYYRRGCADREQRRTER